MAAIDSNIKGSKFIGSPIVVTVTRGNVPSNAIFHRVRLVVTVNTSYKYEFSTTVGNATSYDFDISSALQSVAETYKYTPDGINPIPNTNYPSYNFTLEAYDDYMVDGVFQKGKNGSTLSDSGYYVGRLTDRERLKGTVPSRWSRKPITSPEIVFAGSTLLVPGSGSTPRVDAVTIIGDATGNFYAIPDPADGYEIRFINSLGVHENVFVTCLRTADVGIKTSRYVIPRQQSFSDISHGITRKQNNRERWKMSSAPLDREWQQWYLHEFLMAETAWIKVGTPRMVEGKWMLEDRAWIPCHILPEETTKGIDRQKPSLLSVEFTIEFDINGSPF